MPGNSEFRSLVSPHLDGLYRLAYRLTGAQADAEDAVQDVLIKLYERRAELCAIADLGQWSRRVLYNHFIDQRRRLQRQRLTLVDPIDLDEHDGGNDPAQGEMRDLEAALARLSDEHRIVVLLHDSEGYKLSEIQSLTGVPVGTLKSRLNRARHRLKSILQENTQGNGTFSPAASCKSHDGARNNHNG